MMTFPAQSVNETAYFIRVALVIGALIALIAAALLFAPRPEDIRVVQPSPTGIVPIDSVITVVFSRPVDRRSAERAFILYPPAPGRIHWVDDTTMVFTPAEALQPATRYNVTISAGLRDKRNVVNHSPTAWSFLTR